MFLSLYTCMSRESYSNCCVIPHGKDLLQFILLDACSWAFRLPLIFCYYNHAATKNLGHMLFAYVCRINFQKWHCWVKGYVHFKFWQILPNGPPRGLYPFTVFTTLNQSDFAPCQRSVLSNFRVFANLIKEKGYFCAVLIYISLTISENEHEKNV